MLIVRMDTMLGKIRRVGVVNEIVERCNDGTVEEFGEGEFAGGIKCGVNADSREGREKGEGGNEDEREWSVC